MGDERTLYESESRRTVDEVIDFLQQLTHWLGDRKLAFDDGGQTVEITIPHDVVLELEIEEEDEGDGRVRRSLEIDIEWLHKKESAVSAAAVAEAEIATRRAAALVEEEE